jgi:hypothetical protein
LELGSHAVELVGQHLQFIPRPHFDSVIQGTSLYLGGAGMQGLDGSGDFTCQK